MKHLKYSGNVYCVMSNLNKDQDMRARHKTTNYYCCMQLVGFSHASRTFSLKHRNIPEIIFWCSRFSELYSGTITDSYGAVMKISRVHVILVDGELNI